MENMLDDQLRGIVFVNQYIFQKDNFQHYITIPELYQITIPDLRSQ